MDRAPADAAALQNADGHVFGGAAARVLEETRQHVVLALVEVARRGVCALLERDDVEPRARELAKRHGAARPGADDDGVDVEDEILRQVASGDHRAARAHRAPRQPEAGRPTSGPS